MEGRPRPFQRLIETRRNFAVRATIASMHPNGELEQKESDHEICSCGGINCGLYCPVADLQLRTWRRCARSRV